jgi:hypothetical protein
MMRLGRRIVSGRGYPAGAPMASFLTFNPSLDKLSTIEIRDFYLGTNEGKGADGRGYPGHMRRLWVKDQREGIAIMTAIPHTEAERDLPSVKPIRWAIDNGAIFTKILVVQPKRWVTMHFVKITRYTEYLNEPNQMFLKFEHFSEVSR